MENLKIALVMIVLLIVALFFVKNCTKSEKPIIINNPPITIKGKTDTILKYDTIYLYFKGKGKDIVYDKKPVETEVNGKAVIVNPFVAKLDTALGKDSFRIKYSYPLNEFELNYKRYDSIQFISRTDTLKTTNTVIESKPWYEYLIYCLGGFAVGYFLK